MRIIKPNWVTHEDEKSNPQTIYSIHVHPDGTRLATGSLQNLIKIWSTAPILNQALEEAGDQLSPRLLSQMEGHDGAVLCVRWAYSGRFLATSSDDAIVMVWFRSLTGNPSKSFGAKTTNIEDWKPWKRLAGHTSDVTGVAWSHDDQFLASVGLDNLVLIWDGLDSSFVLLKRLDLHQGFVKGVVWDPVGQYLATQSDDRTVKIWRTTDWKLEADIRDPFVGCPTSTFFRRLSWSPDGAHLVTPNAMNGPVFVSAVIDRDQWTSSISLVGHENVVEVAAYNPNMFLKDKNKPVEGFNICSALALGARNSISIWLTNFSSPILVLHDVFDRDILDLTWAADGVTLYACSSEGHVAGFVIDEIMSIIHLTTPEVKKSYLKTYPFEKLTRTSQPRLQSAQTSRFMSPLPAVEPYRAGSIPTSVHTASVQSQQIPNQPQQMTIMPNGKRRIRPVFLGQNEATMISGYSSSVPDGYPTPEGSVLMVEDSRSVIARQTVGTSMASNVQAAWLEIPPIQRTLSVTATHPNHNNIDEPSGVKLRIVSSLSDQEVWSQEVLGRRVISISLNTTYAAIGCDDGTLLVYTPTGRQALPTIALDSACCILQLNQQFLMTITSHGTIMIWNVKEGKSVGLPIRLNDLSIPKGSISSTSLTSNGLPIINTESGSSFTFDRDLMTWIYLKPDDQDHSTLFELETKLHGEMILGKSNSLEVSLMSYLRELMSTKSVRKIEEFCSDLWSGQGALFGEDRNPSEMKLKLRQEDRIWLLRNVIEYLDREDSFRSICDAYHLLLKHLPSNLV
ncbi:WD40-repeat-containing domain protein [Melampsora americana]|nr:WD40-repeat-containing domain protein [Melampsora americana]